MATSRFSPLAGAAFLALTALLAACGGGGGGGGTSGGGGGGGVPPTVAPPTNPPATPASITGSMSVGATGVSSVVFTCGCSSQAGVVSATNGQFTITTNASAAPPSPSPIYTAVPGRNYMLIGSTSGGAQTWSMEFLGSVPANNISVMGVKGASPTAGDVTETAVALYIYYASSQYFSGSSDQSFDQWNFNSIASWAQHLKASTPTPAESKLMTDITAQQNANKGLYPSVPVWDHAQMANPLMASDLNALYHETTDTTKPTPCPTAGCTGAPTP